ncbi:tail fiber protein [Synechococcus phage Syn5]|uniref:Tail fiber n=1 Tax=Synechococcus phage Syn5 TaxID=2914003 RepID=A4ZRC7_9CAUD|nr:tail fiber protein [Synechococcus phage Syn5]ABP87953.1 tail fiber [Synechococcus phage Syn5]
MATIENLYTGDGGTVLFSFTFPYLQSTDVKATLDGVATTEYTLANATTLRFNSPPAVGVSIRIFRETALENVKATFFPGSAVRAQDLNDNFEQTLFVTQEAVAAVEQSDAASVLGIANQALTTAQAAETNAAASAASAAAAVQAGDNVSQLTNDAGYLTSAVQSGDNISVLVNNAGYLSSSSSVGDLSDVDITTVAPTNGQALVWNAAGGKFAPGSVASSGGGGGGGGSTYNITYNGPAAWGDVAANGTLLDGLNVSSVTRTGTGQYTVVLATAMPNANYSVSSGGEAALLLVSNKTTTQFVVETVAVPGGGAANQFADRGFSFTIHATNALPPQGGTGADAWGDVESNGSIFASFNIASVVQEISAGEYTVTFTNPMPTNRYSVVVSPSEDSAPTSTLQAQVSTKTVNGFKVHVLQDSGTGVAGSYAQFSFVVNATNATLPQSFTSEQVNAAIYNPGASAWGRFNSAGTLEAGLNVASVTKVTTGTFDVVFTTAMPDAKYSVTCNGSSSNADVIPFTVNETANGFRVITHINGSGVFDSDISFVVHATNALPLTGGTGADAWAQCGSSGGVIAGFNIASCTRNSLGDYTVNFTNPMPTALYSVALTAVDNVNITNAQVTSQTTTGFVVATGVDGNLRYDSAFNLVVHATNAVLPQAFTEQEIQQVVDLAQRGDTNPGASAWATVAANGTLNGGLNIASVSKAGTGLYDFTFATAMPNANYSVLAEHDNGYGFVSVVNKVATGFRIETRDSASTLADSIFNLVVHATNALPLTGGTGTDSWGSFTSAGVLEGAFNVASITRNSTGNYSVVFTNPMPDDNYAPIVGSEEALTQVVGNSVTTSGFSIAIYDYLGNPTDARGYFTVNATNAVLPQAFTEQQIQTVVDLAQSGVTNPGVSAWGVIAGGTTPSVTSGLNVASVTFLNTGYYRINLSTPMPNADYAVSASPNDTISAATCTVHTKTASSFEVYVNKTDGQAFSADFEFVLAATNALPLKGGTGADAWLEASSSGVLGGSFNIASVTRSSTGTYDVVFTTSMPTANYAVNATVLAFDSSSIFITNKTVSGFTVNIYHLTAGASRDLNFSAVVHATNATLPLSFTSEQIQTALDNAAVINVDAAQNHVGIGTTATGNTLEVQDSAAIVNIFNTDSTNNNSHAAVIQATNGTQWNQLNLNGGQINLQTFGVTRTTVDGNSGLLSHYANDDVLDLISAQGAGTGQALIAGRHSGTGIGTGSVSFIVYNNGNVLNTNNSYGALSDINLKENIVPASSQWNNIRDIEIVNYNFKAETGNETNKQLGVIAQQVEEISPGLVNTDAEGVKSVNYSVLYMKSVKALQEAMNRIEALEARLSALEDS